jgi:hypothetical protein
VSRQDGPEADVLRAATDRATALAARDWPRFAELLHPDFVYTSSQGRRLDRAAYLDFVQHGPLRWNAQWIEDARVVVDGGTAVLTGVVVDDVVTDDGEHLLRFATTQTYVGGSGGWRYLAGQTAPIDVS